MTTTTHTMKANTVDTWKAAAIARTTPTADSRRIHKAITANTDRYFAGKINKCEWNRWQRRLWNEAAARGCADAVSYAISR